MMKFSSHTFAQWLGMFRDFLLGTMGVFCVGIAIYFTYGDRLQAASLLFTAGLLLCIFSSLSRFESIKGLGVEAKMAALSHKLSEADELLKHMRNMVGLMADTSFQIIGNLGRWDAEIPKPEMLKIVQNFNELLVALGEPSQEIERRLNPWHGSNMRDLAQPILGALHKFAQFQNQLLTDQARQPEDQATLTPAEITERFERNSDFIRRANELWNGDINKFPDAVEDLIRKSNNAAPAHRRWLEEQLSGALEDLRFYLENKRFKDLAAWLARPYAWEIPLDFTNFQ